jgi:hypothetical protein
MLQSVRYLSVTQPHTKVTEFAINKVKALLVACFLLVACLPYSLTLNTEAVCSFKISVNFYQIILHHIPEDSTLQNKNYITWHKTCNIVDGILHILIKSHYLYINCEISCHIKCRNLPCMDINL